MNRLVAAAALALLLTGCAGGGPRAMSRDRYERAIAGAPGAAQPSKVVAAELAFARMAREDGQWTAFRAFAAPGAIMLGQNGPVDAKSWLTGLADPAKSISWNPRAVWMSCDGMLAVSQGRFREPDGSIGSFVTVWQRQSGDEYRWIFDAGARDDPQPSAEARLGPAGEDEIVVSALDAIEGMVADCNRRGEPVPLPPALPITEATQSGIHLSADGTLRWRWEDTPGQDRRFVAEYLTGGQWEIALEQRLAKAAPAAAIEQ